MVKGSHLLNTLAPDVESHLLGHRDGKREGTDIRFRCPLPDHADEHPSARYNLHKRAWLCDACGGRGGLIKLAELLGIPDEPGRTTGSEVHTSYAYRDERGQVLFKVVRIEKVGKPKRFFQRRLAGENGWVNNLSEVRRVLYRLPELLKSDSEATVFVVEGEKDADTLVELGLIATTNPGGAGKWDIRFAENLRERHVAILPDNDEPGKNHAAVVASSLCGVARSVRVVQLPGLANKGDVSDWIAAGHTTAELLDLVKREQVFPATALEPPRTSRLVLRRPSEVVAHPVRWLVENFIPGRMLSVLHAGSKQGKTLLAWELAQSVVLGRKFLGRFRAAQGLVVGAFLDDPSSLTMERCRALGLDNTDQFRLLLPEDSDLSKPRAFFDDLENECRPLSPRLIILDALYCLGPRQADAMNDAAQMAPVVERIDRLTRTVGSSVLLVAHDRKTGGLAHSYVIAAEAKALLHLTRPYMREGDRGKRLLTVIFKGAADTSHALKCNGVGSWTYLGLAGSTTETKIANALHEIMRALQQHGEMGYKDLQDVAQLRKEDLFAAVAKGLADGTLIPKEQPRSDGKGGKPRTVFRAASEPEAYSGLVEEEKIGNNRSEEKIEQKEIHFSSSSKEISIAEKPYCSENTPSEGGCPEGSSASPSISGQEAQNDAA